jgi:Zn-dependent protease with chaperone function
MIMNPVGAAPADRSVGRPNLLAFPTPTTTRYLALLAALVTAGFFMGSWLHNEIEGAEYVRVTYACWQAAPGGETSDWPAMLAADEQRRACRAGVEQVRAGYLLAGAGAVVLGGLGILLLAPRRIRHSRQLAPAGDKLAGAAQRVAELAAEAGLSRAPAVMVGRQADTFTFGVPGRYVIALSRGLAVRWRYPQLFDPVLRHELAHVRHGDVPLALLARSVGLMLAPLLVLPLLVGLVIGDSSLTPSYLWRAALLGTVVVLVSAQLLRTREYDADLRAAQLSGGAAVVSTVLSAFAPRPEMRWFRRPLAKHPSHAQRVAVLERPAGAAPVTFLDGFAAAFLAALVVPLLVSLVIAATVGALSTTVAEVTAAAMVGALLGGSVGLAQWRASVVGRLDAVRLSPWPAACGVGIGLAAGEMASLGNVAFISPLGDTPPEWYVVVGVAGLSCTLLGHGAGEVWADAVPTLPAARLVWVPALLVTGLLYTVLCWAGQALDLLLAAGGWPMVMLWMVAMPQRWLPALALVVLVAAVGYGLVAGRRTGIAPRWLLKADAQVSWPRWAPAPGTVLSTALGAGLVGAATIISFRLLAGPGGSDEQTVVRFVIYIAIAAAVGWVAAFGLALLRPRTGLAVGTVVLPIAVVTTMAGFFALNAALGGGLDQLLVTNALLGPTVAGFFLLLLAAPALWFARGRDRVRRVWVVTTPIAVAAALLVLGIGSGVGSVVGGLTESRLNPSVAVTDYQLVLGNLLQRHEQVREEFRSVLSDPTLDDRQRAGRLRAHVLPLADSLLADARAYRPPTPQIERAHGPAVSTLEAAQESLSLLATALETQDAGLLDRAEARWREHDQAFERWAAAVAELPLDR